MLRPLVERATRQATFRRRLPQDLGGASMYVTPAAGLRYLFRSMSDIDPGLWSLVKEYVHRDQVVWDVGANLGLFSFAAAHRAGSFGSVVSFEPDAWMVQLLRRSTNLQPSTSAPVVVVPAAVASSCDLRTFNIARRSRATNYLAGYGSTQTGGIGEQQTVVTVSLDWLARRLPRPDVIKIDVEGAELEVLKGAIMLLRSARPILLCEVCAESSSEVSALLHELGYRIYDGEKPAALREELKIAPWSTVAIATSRSNAPATNLVDTPVAA